MADQVEQVEEPVHVEGILRVDTGKRILSVPFEDLRRFPNSLLARCVEGAESEEVVIQTERDADHVETILKYYQDKSGSALQQILNRGWKFTSAIAEEAGFFIMDKLARECREALHVYGDGIIRANLITSKQKALAIYEHACLEKKGLIFINRLLVNLHSIKIFEDLRLLDLDNVELHNVIIKEFGCGELMAFKLPGSNSLRSIDKDASVLAFIYKFNLGVESDSWRDSALFSARGRD